MLFNSLEFLIFLPIVFLGYWFACRSGEAKNRLLLAASYLFYGYWDWRFLGLIIGVSAVSYLAGRALESPHATAGKRRRVLWSTIAVDAGVLFLFKYFDFFTQSSVRLLQALGFTPDVPTLDLILPVGISFYTFQALSYTLDVYHKRIAACRNAVTFFVFIAFFPQLVAGPIERASNMLPQFARNRHRFSYRRGVSGMKLILWGLFKKMVVADNAAVVVNNIFGNMESVGTLNLWIGVLLFTFQIYGDFSGYSDIAIGASRLFGIDLMKNFSLPYFSRDIPEFWRRWHISLTSWFRDYVYIPLGGNRRGRRRTVANTFIVFLTSGLWHGASFTYVAWGLYHAVLFVPSLYMRRHRVKAPPAGRDALYMGLTFLLVMIGWVLFRAESIADAGTYLKLMFSHFSPVTFIMGKIPLVWVALLLAAEWATRHYETPLTLPHIGLWRHAWVRWSVCTALFCITVIFAGSTQDFIYFKF